MLRFAQHDRSKQAGLAQFMFVILNVVKDLSEPNYFQKE
jgi:hypothetical protein